ncbi:MAG: PorV/PorQ family protein [Candidatus Cloacimonetes bacterium]|nr:PorV/PorQ family protein [Candidatus Cloacimonadota bacterium]
MFRYVFVLISLLLVTSLFAETSGEYGFQMLNITSSVGIAAQSGVGAFSSDDAHRFLQHPTAGLFGNGRVISISKNFWIFDTPVNNVSYLFSNGKRSFGFSYKFLDYGKIDRRDEVGTDIIGEFHPLDISVAVNFAYRLNPNHQLGFNFIGVYEKIDTHSSTGIALDLGYLYKTPLQDIMVSLALKNIGISSKMDKEEIKLPFKGELGFIKDFKILEQKFSSEFQLLKHIDDDQIRYALGLNSTIYQLLDLRIGYKNQNDSASFSTGIGINYKQFSVDYTFIPTFDDLDSVNMIGLSYKF